MNDELRGSGPPQTPGRTSGLAIASLVLGILSCLIFPAPIAIILGIVALVQMGKDPHLKGKGMAIAGIALAAVTPCLFGILAAIAIPNFIKFTARSKQIECKTNLKALHAAATAYHAEYGAHVDDLGTIGFSPEGTARYAYVASLEPKFGPPGKALVGSNAFLSAHEDGLAEDAVREALRRPLAGDARLGVEGACPDCELTAICVGDLDSDETQDIWSISTRERQDPNGKPIPAGVPHNELNDVTE